jgi:hypothetical protein
MNSLETMIMPQHWISAVHGQAQLVVFDEPRSRVSFFMKRFRKLAN